MKLFYFKQVNVHISDFSIYITYICIYTNVVCVCLCVSAYSCFNSVYIEGQHGLLRTQILMPDCLGQDPGFAT